MISIVIASVNEKQLNDVKLNISQTIGVTHEIIAVENSKGNRGICEIYNEGAGQAKYELLCFMHEDVEIKTIGWGHTVLKNFEEQHDLGLMGIAGSSYKTMVPSGWFCDSGTIGLNYVNILQRYKSAAIETQLNYKNPNNERNATVVVIDGVWFCTKKEVVERFKFDEHTFKKFHCYDLDFSLQISAKYKAIVSYEILIEHFSEGSYDRTWVEETLLLQQKWSKYLPIDLVGLNKREKFIAEKYTYRFFLKTTRSLGYSSRYIFKLLVKSALYKRDLLLFLRLAKEIFYSK